MSDESEESPVFYVGVDLGQERDYTAIVIVEAKGERLNVVHIQRLPLHTSYPAVAQAVARIYEKVPGEKQLVVDNTGIGRAVYDLLTDAGLNPVAVTFTSGNEASHEGRKWNVPQKDIVYAAKVALQQERLKIAATLPEARTLTSELQNFEVKINAKGHDSYGAPPWRQGSHDDLVFALGIAVWGSKMLKPRRFFAVAGKRRW